MHREARVQPACICFKNSRLWLSSSRTRFCSARAAAEYCPCFQRACLDRSSPSAVRGPVLAPPCMRHLPLAIAGERHAVPRRVLAPHLGAEFGSPTGLPFFSRLGRSGAARSFDFLFFIVFWGLSRTRMVYRSYNCLTTVCDIYISYDHRLRDHSAVAVESFQLRYGGS
jgi:hypothetical protein